MSQGRLVLKKFARYGFYFLILWVIVSLVIGMFIRFYGVFHVKNYSKYYFAPGYKSGDVIDGHFCLMPPTGCPLKCMGDEVVIGGSPKYCGMVKVECRGILLATCDQKHAWIFLLRVLFVPMNMIVD